MTNDAKGENGKQSKSDPEQFSGVTGDVTIHKLGPFRVWGIVYTGLMMGATITADRTAAFNVNMGNKGRSMFFTNGSQWESFSATDENNNFGTIIFQGFDVVTKELAYAYMSTPVSSTPPTTMPGWTIGTITLNDPVVIEQPND